MKTSDFDYPLPSKLIAQSPLEPRDHSRLMVLDRKDGSIRHSHFFEITDYLRERDVLVFNDSRVIPARLLAKKETGGTIELLLLRRIENNVWETLVKRGRNVRPGSAIQIYNGAPGSAMCLTAEIKEAREDGIKVIKFPDESLLPFLGKVPLPPYIHAPLANPERYQTVYARTEGSAAAPTAGLHFTPELINRLKSKGIICLFITLHIGLDTFQPVKEDDPSKHKIHKEYAVLNPEVASALSLAKSEGRRVICVGTTTVRVLEQSAQLSPSSQIKPFEDWVSLFILPGYRFRVVDGLVTNFHLPRSTLLMLVSAFAGKELIKEAYNKAINLKYRFYSFGDAMLVI